MPSSRKGLRHEPQTSVRLAGIVGLRDGNGRLCHGLVHWILLARRLFEDLADAVDIEFVKAAFRQEDEHLVTFP